MLSWTAASSTAHQLVQFARPSVTTAWSAETTTYLAACRVPCVGAVAVHIYDQPGYFAYVQIRAVPTARQS